MKKKLLVMAALLLMLLPTAVMATTVKLWYAWTGQEKEAMMGIVAKYQQVSGNKVDALMVPFDALQGKYQTMAPQGQGPDVVIGPADWIGPFVQQRLIESVDGYASSADLNGFMPTVLNASKYSGKLYGLPESYKVVALVYNKDLVPNPPKNSDELIKIGKSLTNDKASKYGLVYDKGNFYYHVGWVGGFGGRILDSKNNPTFTSKAQIDAAKFVKSLHQAPNQIMPEEVDYNVAMNLFSSKLAGMMISGPWAIGDLAKSGINFGVTRLPMISSTNRWPSPLVGPEVVMMSAYSKDKNTAFDLMKFITSSKSQETMAKVGHLPSRVDVYTKPSLKANARMYNIIMGFKYQAEVGSPMPTAPEMNAGVWSNGNTYLSQVLSTNKRVEDIAKDVQARANESIKEMRKRK